MSHYKQGFYEERHRKTVYSAETILDIVQEAIPLVASAVDVGCGVGTWLSVLQARGAEVVQGFDGPWVERSLLEIPEDAFQSADLEKPIRAGQRYDLCISLEVAEHVSPENAGQFVDSLTGLSDFILFSAAIPRQGGTHHVNEQWPEYWSELFAQRDYVLRDIIRRRVWDNTEIPFWYRQNMMLFVRNSRVKDLLIDPVVAQAAAMPLSLVHPEMYQEKVQRMENLGDTWKLFRRSLKRRLKGA